MSIFKREWDTQLQIPVSQHMDIAIQRQGKDMHLSVSKHIAQLLSMLRMEDCNPARLPHDPKGDYSLRREHEEIISDEKKTIYAQAVGLARFITDTVALEIFYINSQLARALSEPTQRHFAALKRLARYLAGRQNHALIYRQGTPMKLTAYSDSDWGSCPSIRRSRTGLVLRFGGNLIHWQSKLQPSVTLSTAEAEYTACAEVSRAIVWITQLANECNIPIEKLVELCIDNSGAIDMSNANGPTTRSKHIDIKAHYISERIRKGDLYTKQIPTNERIVDNFTKAIPAATFYRLIKLAGDSQK